MPNLLNLVREKGKGAVSHFVSPVKPGTILYEVDGVVEQVAKRALLTAAEEVAGSNRLRERGNGATLGFSWRACLRPVDGCLAVALEQPTTSTLCKSFNQWLSEDPFVTDPQTNKSLVGRIANVRKKTLEIDIEGKAFHSLCKGKRSANFLFALDSSGEAVPLK